VVFAQKNRGDAIDYTRDGFGRDEVLGPDYISDRVRSDLTSVGFNAIFDAVLGMDRVVVRGRAFHELRQGGELYNDDYEIPEDIYENPFTLGTERITTDRYETEVSLSRAFGAGNGLEVSVAYARHDRNATNDTFTGDYESIHGEPPPVDLLRPYLATENLMSTNVTYSHPIPSRHRFIVGAQLTHDQFEESGMYVVVDEEDEDYGQAYRSTSEKRATDIGLYAQDEFVASDELEFVFGLRFDHHASEDAFRGSGSVAPEGVPSVEYEESSVNPRVAVRYSPAERLAFRASVGTGFRVPFGFSEDLHLCSGSPRVWKGDGLKPERSVSYNVSADYYGERWTLGASLYRVDMRDKVGLVDASESAAARGYTYEWENIDDAFVQGIEVDARHEVTAALVLNAYATLAQGKYDNAREDWVGTEHEDESVHISRLPKYSAGLGVEYRPTKWNVVVDANLQGPLYIDYFADGEEPTKIKETETFVIVNTKVSREVASGVELFAGARNLTDYVQEEKHTDDAAFMYAPVFGRIFYGGIAVGF
jgi:outer membrane receptor for ferrienterochelin and colicins